MIKLVSCVVPFFVIISYELLADKSHADTGGDIESAIESAIESVDTFYGTISLAAMEHDQSQLLSSLLVNPAFNRLKHINQYGPIQMVDSQNNNNEPYSRYDHSLGVFYLLNRFGASFPEQVSGLLHDLPHSTFSHVSDYLFSDSSAGNPDYHDSQFIQFVNSYNIAPILNRYRLSPEMIDPKNNPSFTRLERPLPDLAADRLDYIVQGAARRKKLTDQQVGTILADLFFDPLSKHWYFRSQESARLTADASIELNRHIFVTAWGRVLYLWTAEALKQLVMTGELQPDDLFFTMGDDQVWQKIHQSTLPAVRILAAQMLTAWHKVHEVTQPGANTITFENVRCRIVDPRVVTTRCGNRVTGWLRVSDIDPAFRDRYLTELKRCQLFYAEIEP
ncbi:HD domain-containing protein [Endozoicomonas sp. SCSIO W0465]|uniref:HD domain-containing protein n=1 Tax=Endozoicomonas sp. SCSIO W0465 TaxID=2918516 RepID=UPI0020753C45|nr:HD domain-containing protein [Endozoicomonas sp. SCSIO W0465]USE34759.1 HD domain-containing protein [Endozoicomonas sp. SCSIO W0465]